MAAGRSACSCRVLRPIRAAAALALATSAARAFLSAAPRLGSRASALAGSTRSAVAPEAHPEARDVGRAAEPELLASLPSEISSFPVLFFLTFLPAILFEELIVLKKNGKREYVTGSDDSIAVQIPYAIDNWEKHRSNPERFGGNLLGLFTTSTLLKRLQGPLLLLNSVAAFALFYDLYMVPQGWAKLSLQTLPFTISSFALSLLLIFRVNNATMRYVKARDLWGDMLNISRDLTQQASQWTSREDFVDFARWVPAFTTSLMYGLRSPKKHDLAQELWEAAGSDLALKGAGAGLTEEEIQMICSRPQGMLAHHYVTHMLRTKVKLMELPLEQRLMMENNITRLINDMGACENIFATPIPLAYTKHTTRFLLLWLLFLPFALEPQLGVGIVFVQQLLSFCLLGIEDIGLQIEQPFDVLPLKKICFKIANEGQIVRANFDTLEEHTATSRSQQQLQQQKALDKA